MTWATEAAKHVNTPVVLVSIAFNSGTRYYSNTYIETATQLYKGNILNLPEISSSVGDIDRTYERNKIRLLFSDADYEFRGLEESETVSFKNRVVTIKVGFAEDSYANLLTLFTGYIYDWRRLDNLQYEFEVEERSLNLENEYPDKRVDRADYSLAAPSALKSAAVGWVIPIPYGTISALGLSGDGAFGHPSLSAEGSGTGLLFVDTTADAEKHLVGLQIYDEMILNGGFDTDTSNWGVLSMSTLASVAGGKSGNCLRVTGDGASNPGAYQDITVVPGSYYRTRVYMKAGTENEYSIEIYNRDDTSYIYDSGDLIEAAGDWSTVHEVVWQAPAGCTTASVFMRHSGGSGAAKTFYFDSVITYEVIGVPRVYKDGVLQTEGSGNDYQIEHSIVDTYSHCLVAWEAGNNPTEASFISCDIVFGSRRPVEAIRHFLDNFCGYTYATDFNATSYTAAVAKEADRSYTFDGALWQKIPLRSILDMWRSGFELDIYWDKDGLLCFKYLSSEVSSSPNSYTAERDILSGFDSDPLVYKLLNKLKYGYNYHYAKTYYYNYATREDTDSQTKYGATFEDFKGFEWIRSASVANDIASRKVIRFKDPITFDAFKFPLKTFSDDLTDTLKITHFEGIGSSGYNARYFQIRKVSYDINSYINSVILEDASSFTGKSCILGDTAVQAATWPGVADPDSHYCYLCDIATGQFADGTEGKRLFD